jgi:tetratricopeptide (TPR) repeat protein
MDRRHLHDLGANRGAMRAGEEHAQGAPGDEDDDSEVNFLRARAARRIRTSNAADSAGPSRYPQPSSSSTIDDLARHDSLDEPLASPASLPTASSSWDDQSDDESDRIIARRDRLKFEDATTPTLLDEEDFDYDEEQEMVSLEHERLRRPEPRAFFGTDESSLRRTPGAQMYKSSLDDQQSMRRTPGASQMMSSTAATAVMQQKTPGADSSGLGFGLTLSTPVAASYRAKAIKGVAINWERSALGSESSPISAQKSQDGAQVTNRPPLAPGSSGRDQRGAFVSPWALSKNAHLEANRGSYSPNTLRLTEDLGNLLLEDDDADTSREFTQPIFRDDIPASQDPDDTKQESNESWTTAYVISVDGPSRVPRSGSRNRRVKNETGRRSRGTPTQATAKTGGFLPYAQQPKPVRRTQPPAFGTGNQFTFNDAARNSPADSEERSSPRLINFGGAFAPPPKAYAGNFGRPVPSQMGSESNPGHFVPPPHDVHRQSTFQPNSTVPFGTGTAGFHNPFQPPHHSFGSHGVPNFQQRFSPQDAMFGNNPTMSQQRFSPQDAMFGNNPTMSQQQFSPQDAMFGNNPTMSQQRFSPQDAMFGNNPTMSQSQIPNFGFGPPNVGPYHMHPGSMHPPPPEFMPNMPVHPHQRQPVPQFGPPQVWQQAMPMHFAGPPMEQQNWHGPMGGWPMGEYVYGMPPGHGNARMSVTPAPTWPAIESQFAIDPSTNPFAMLQQSGMHQPGPPARRTAARNQNRSKNQRTAALQKGARNQPRSDTGQKVEPSANQAFSGKKAPSSATTKTKKKQAKDRSTPPAQKDRSTPPAQSIISHSASASDEVGVPQADDPATARRAELMESPATRSAFKDFYRKFRAEERTSFQDAEGFAVQALEDGSLPEEIRWRVYLELADLAKRANRFDEARKLYQQVCHLQPEASQGWLEYSKLEEECGNMNLCAKILRAGLGYCQYSENLLTRAIKHEEKMGNLVRARELLARLKHVGIEKVWRTVLEGALLEARAGNDVMARRVLKYLMHHVPWYGPLYLEAYRLERDLGRPPEALSVVERGLAAIPRYGPLWFGAFRLCEAMDHSANEYHLPQSMAMIDRATFSISKELIWKVHLEAAQMLERAFVEHLDETTEPTAEKLIEVCRQRFATTILTCPPNLRWKVWLAAGRMEVAAGKSDTARKLFLRAHQVVPDKGRAVALLECARLEEFVGDPELASAILCKSRAVSGSDWKVWFESVLLEIRGGNYSRAVELSTDGLEIHSGTGRLWASLVHLRHFDGGEEAQFTSLKRALNAVPKSGEVWCEGARIHLNPLSRTFDIDRARRHLFFATKFTPQYGDGFLETLKLEVLEQWFLPIAIMVWESTQRRFYTNAGLDQGKELVKYMLEVYQAVITLCSSDQKKNSDAKTARGVVVDNETATVIRQRLRPGVHSKLFDMAQLQLRCANADPNYGLLWFHCRLGPTDTARNVLSRALEVMLVEMRAHAHIYISAFVRRFAVIESFGRRQKVVRVERSQGMEGVVVQDSVEWEELLHKTLLAAPSLKQIHEAGIKKYKTQAGMDLLKSTMTGSDFVTGLVELSKYRPMDEMSLPERRKALFGTDALFS